MSNARVAAKSMSDFKKKLLEVEMSMSSIGAEVLFNLKVQHELEGRCVEYVWGTSKALLRK